MHNTWSIYRQFRKSQKYYDPVELQEPLKKLWLLTDQSCGKRLKSALPLWLPAYERHYGELSAVVRTKLLKISAATIDRMLSPLKCHYPRRFGGTKPGTLLRKQIPIKTDQWDEKQPGFVESDTVAH